MIAHTDFIKSAVLRAMYCLSILLFLGCAAYQVQKQLDMFEKTADSYGLAIRWGHYEMAHKFLRINDKESPAAQSPEKFKDIKVTSYEVQAINFSGNKRSSTQTVEIQYYNINRMVEKTLIDRQEWEYDMTAQQWYLRSGLPDFR